MVTKSMDGKHKFSQPSAPEFIPVRVHSNLFRDDAHARDFMLIVELFIKDISQHMNLSRLAEVVVTSFMDRDLLELDRGFPVTQPLTRTNDGIGLGVAMAPLVLRDGIWKRCLFLSADTFYPLEKVIESGGSNTPQFREALYLLAHECGHIHELEHFDRMFPGKLGQPWKTAEDELYLDPLLIVWQEYAATRLAAPFAFEEIWLCNEELVVKSLDHVNIGLESAFSNYQQYKNAIQLHYEVGSTAFLPLKCLGYLLGLIDGVPLNWDNVPEVRSALEADPFYRSISEKMGKELKKLWHTMESWGEFEIFNPIKSISKEVFEKNGLVFHMQPGNKIALQIIDNK